MMTQLGYDGLELQPGATVTIDAYDGLMQGTAEWIGDAKYLGNGPQTGDPHPHDNRLQLIKIAPLTYLKLGKVSIKAEYLGIIYDPTTAVPESPGGSGQDSIQTHPNFAQFAGTPDSPLNGAIFDDTTQEFIGFGPGQFAGVSTYITPYITARVTWWSHYQPQQVSIGKIIGGGLPNFTPPPNCPSQLCIGMSFQIYGNLYKISAEVLCAPQWNPAIYN